MDGGLLIPALVGKAAVVNTLVVPGLLQMPINGFCPGFPPLEQLFFTVPFGGDGILPAKLCALGVFAGPLIALGLGSGGRHIKLLLATVILFISFPCNSRHIGV